MFLLPLFCESGPVIEALSEKTGKLVDQFTSEEWSTLFSAVENVVLATNGSRTPLTHMTKRMLRNIKSERFKLALIFLLPKAQRNFLIGSFLKPGGLSDTVGFQHIYFKAAGEAIMEQKLWPSVIAFYQKVIPNLGFKIEWFLIDGEFYYGLGRIYYGPGEKMNLSIAKQISSDPAIGLIPLNPAATSC